MNYNQLAKNIKNAGKNIQGDEACKKVLANRQILAWILISCADECRGMTRKEIEQAIIGKPEILSIPVHQDEMSVTEEQEEADFVTNEGTEDISVNEGVVRYDICFSMQLPAGIYRMKLIVNVEAQGSSHLSYAVETRGIYYCSRLISAQYRKEFKNSHYEKIKKVYSIWICLNPKAQDRASIIEYSLKRNVLSGNPADKPVTDYDKMKVVIINLGGKEKDGVIGMLNTLFDKASKSDKKLKELHEYYDIEVNEELRQEVADMCNVNYYYLEQGLEQGLARSVYHLMKKKHFTLEEAMEILEISEESREKIIRLLDEKMQMV